MSSKEADDGNKAGGIQQEAEAGPEFLQHDAGDGGAQQPARLNIVAFSARAWEGRSYHRSCHTSRPGGPGRRRR